MQAPAAAANLLGHDFLPSLSPSINVVVIVMDIVVVGVGVVVVDGAVTIIIRVFVIFLFYLGCVHAPADDAR